MKLCTKYQKPGPFGFRQEDFRGFLYISLCKTCQPQGNNVNTGRGPLGEAMYHISRPGFFRLCWSLTTRQPLWVILCRLPEKGRKETEEIAEEIKERDREERGTGMKVKKQKK